MSEVSGRGIGRISIDASLHDLYKELSEGNDSEVAPFRTMKDVFMTAACFGYRRGLSQPISGAKRQIFHWAQFSEQIDIPILKAIAISTSGNVQILADQEQIVQIAEGYANAGIQDLQSHLASRVDQPLWALVSLIRSL